MRKIIAAVTVGLLLVAGQAVASNNAAVARVGDRVGARAADSSEFQGQGGFLGLGGLGGIGAIAAGVTFLGFFAYVATDDSTESGN